MLFFHDKSLWKYRNLLQGFRITFIIVKGQCKIVNMRLSLFACSHSSGILMASCFLSHLTVEFFRVVLLL